MTTASNFLEKLDKSQDIVEKTKREEIRDTVVKRVVEIIDSSMCITDATIVIKLSASEIPTIEYEVREVVAAR